MKSITHQSSEFSNSLKPLLDSVYPVSVIIPVKNEATTIGRLIGGLEAQNFQPAEIVITDGGSTDGTVEVIKDLRKKSSIRIVLVESDFALPGRGRNLAMKQASQPWFACIDAGIVPQPDWLENLIKCAGTNPQAHIIFGSYRPVTDTFFTKNAAIAYCLPAHQTKNESIASCLLHKSVIQTVGYFREDLRSGEDLLFFRELERNDVSKAFSESAIVHWELQPDFKKTYQRFKTYSLNGMKADLFFDWQFGVMRFYIIIFLLLLMSSQWRFWIAAPVLLFVLRAQRRIYNWNGCESFIKRIARSFDPLAIAMIAAINVVVDAAMFHGMILWARENLALQRSQMKKKKRAADGKS